MGDTFKSIEMQTGDVAALKSALAKINLGEVAQTYRLTPVERQSLYELSDALGLE